MPIKKALETQKSPGLVGGEIRYFSSHLYPLPPTPGIPLSTSDHMISHGQQTCPMSLKQSKLSGMTVR